MSSQLGRSHRDRKGAAESPIGRRSRSPFPLLEIRDKRFSTCSDIDRMAGSCERGQVLEAFEALCRGLSESDSDIEVDRAGDPRSACALGPAHQPPKDFVEERIALEFGIDRFAP